MAFRENRSAFGPVYMTSSVLPVPHAFTTRLGGVSTGALESLNLGENRGDKSENVLENYRRLGSALGFDALSMACTRQVHGSTVRIVSDADRRAPYDEPAPEADGIVTGVRGLPIVCFTADCVPVLLCDGENGVIGAIHCGWRSSVADILGVAVGRMLELGAKSESISAAIGPAIGGCCFETGSDVTQAVINWLGPDGEQFFRPRAAAAGKFLVDLRMANRHRLLKLGLREENIDVSQECTMCRSDRYWSHRVTKGLRGSQCAAIVLPEV